MNNELRRKFMSLPHITPTPVSGWIWGLIFIVLLAIVVALGLWAFLRIQKQKSSIVPSMLIVLTLIVGAGFAFSSHLANYASSSSYVKKAKDMQIEYDNKQERNIKVLDYNGKVKYNYTGKFSYDMDEKTKKINLTDNVNGNKISIAAGNNDTVIVSDVGDKK